MHGILSLPLSRSEVFPFVFLWRSDRRVVSYTRMGLLPTMNPRAKGGSEMVIHPDIVVTNIEESGDTPVTTKVLPKGYGRIVRDAEGNVVDIELGDSADGDEEIDEDEDALDLETRQLQPNFATSEREKWAHRRVGNEKDSELIQGTWQRANLLEDLLLVCY
jgi:Ribosome biogenesis protein Nop16